MLGCAKKKYRTSHDVIGRLTDYVSMQGVHNSSVLAVVKACMEWASWLHTIVHCSGQKEVTCWQTAWPLKHLPSADLPDWPASSPGVWPTLGPQTWGHHHLGHQVIDRSGVTEDKQLPAGCNGQARLQPTYTPCKCDSTPFLLYSCKI